jgi:hypothetical protein
MKMYGRVGVQLHTFLTLALNRGEWSPSCLIHFTFPQGKRAIGSHLSGGWVVLRTDLDAAESKEVAGLPGI